MMTQALAVLAGGFLGSAHCIGMCGGFAAALGAGDRPMWPIVARQLVYNLGRVFTYVFLGALAGSSGLYLSSLRIGQYGPQQIFSLIAGVTMLGVGLSALGVLPLPARLTKLGSGLLAPLFAYFLNARGWWGYFAAGLANGFLPCGLVYSFVALAVASGSAAAGMVIMAAFGLGTIPAMLAIGCGSSLLTRAARQRIYRAASVMVIVLGAVTLWRGRPGAEAACCAGENVPAAGASSDEGDLHDCCHKSDPN